MPKRSLFTVLKVAGATTIAQRAAVTFPHPAVERRSAPGYRLAPRSPDNQPIALLQELRLYERPIDRPEQASQPTGPQPPAARRRRSRTTPDPQPPIAPYLITECCSRSRALPIFARSNYSYNFKGAASRPPGSAGTPAPAPGRDAAGRGRGGDCGRRFAPSSHPREPHRGGRPACRLRPASRRRARRRFATRSGHTPSETRSK
jgi:hypothetical protein